MSEERMNPQAETVLRLMQEIRTKNRGGRYSYEDFVPLASAWREVAHELMWSLSAEDRKKAMSETKQVLEVKT